MKQYRMCSSSMHVSICPLGLGKSHACAVEIDRSFGFGVTRHVPGLDCFVFATKSEKQSRSCPKMYGAQDG